jgi:peroxiredoxin
MATVKLRGKEMKTEGKLPAVGSNAPAQHYKGYEIQLWQKMIVCL